MEELQFTFHLSRDIVKFVSGESCVCQACTVPLSYILPQYKFCNILMLGKPYSLRIKKNQKTKNTDHSSLKFN
jgi:hypothetical protein